MFWIELNCVAVRCSALQCVVVCCGVLWCVAVWYSALRCVTVVCSDNYSSWLDHGGLPSLVCCSVLQCVAECCSVLQYVAICCSEFQRVALCCSVLQCVTVCCSVLQCAAVFGSAWQCVAVHPVCCSMSQCVATMYTNFRRHGTIHQASHELSKLSDCCTCRLSQASRTSCHALHAPIEWAITKWMGLFIKRFTSYTWEPVKVCRRSNQTWWSFLTLTQ